MINAAIMVLECPGSSPCSAPSRIALGKKNQACAVPCRRRSDKEVMYGLCPLPPYTTIIIHFRSLDKQVYPDRVKSDSHHHSPKQKKALQLRLRKMSGQLAAIERMVEDDVTCPEVLTQIVSVRRALKSLAELIIHDHLHECIGGATNPREGQRKLRELLTVLERFVE